MSATVTDTTVNFVLQESRSYQFTTVSLIVVLLLILVLLLKEGIRMYGRLAADEEISMLTVLVVPLLLTFVVTMAFRFCDIVNYQW